MLFTRLAASGLFSNIQVQSLQTLCRRALLFQTARKFPNTEGQSFWIAWISPSLDIRMEAAGAQQELLWTRSHPVICQINRPGSWSGCRALTGSGRYVRWQLSPTVTRGRASCQTRLVCLSSSWPPAVCRLLGFQQFWGFELRISILAFDSRYCEGKSCTKRIHLWTLRTHIIGWFENINRLSLSPLLPMLFCQRGQRSTAVLLTGNNCQVAEFPQLLRRLHKMLNSCCAAWHNWPSYSCLWAPR